MGPGLWLWMALTTSSIHGLGIQPAQRGSTAKRWHDDLQPLGAAGSAQRLATASTAPVDAAVRPFQMFEGWGTGL